jgi:hypothetical protein
MGAQKQERFLVFAFALVIIQAATAVLFEQSYALTAVGDVFPCLLAGIAMLAFRDNFRRASGSLRLFWALNGAGLTLVLFSQFFWKYYDALKAYESPSPVTGDVLFLLAPLPIIAALTLRPRSTSAAQDLRFRRLDFLLLILWWVCMYAYFAWPWQIIVRDFSKYNPADYLLTLVEHLAVILGLVFLRWKSAGAWKKCYGHFLFAFVLLAAGNLLQSMAIDRQVYYHGSLFDIPWCLSLAWFTVAAKAGKDLSSAPEAAKTSVEKQGLWTARLAMLAMISLPVLAIWSYLDIHAPPAVTIFRLRIMLGAMLLLGSLVFLKIHLLDRELVYLVSLTEKAVVNLRGLQMRISQSQKMAALGRLVAGAAHEISNPLTAILGYSELLADNPALTAEERECAAGIRKQVRRAQAAVDSMRNLGRTSANMNSSLPEEQK